MTYIFDKQEAIKIIEEKIKWLNDRTAEYDAGNPTVSDAEWDKVYFELILLENSWNYYSPNSPTQNIYYHMVSELEKRRHNHPMLSLDKTKDWNEFLRYFGDLDVVGMLKMDGLTCSLRYENGYLVGAETRGNGFEGEDILHNALVVKNIPNKIPYTDTLVVDGEIICTYKDFEAFKEEYANPRNFAAGSIRLLDASECAKRNLKFYAWELIEGGNYTTHIDNLTFLDSLGITVVPWTSSFDWDAKDFLIETAQKEGLPIDGLVGRFNSVEYGKSLGATSHHSRAAYAFKFADETAITTLENIEWTMGRTGKLTPIAVFNTISLEGTEVSRASLHNISVMEELLGESPRTGQSLVIYKANMIIPQVQGSIPTDDGKLLTIPETCPICGGRTEQVTEIDSTVLMCSNPQCEGKLINRLEHFCSKKGLDIKGLSKATLEKVIEWGWARDYIDIFELYQYEKVWITKPGFGKKSVGKILDAIDYARISCELHQYISALGIPLIGQVAAKQLAEHFDTWEAFLEAATSGTYKFYEINGFGIEMHQSIIKYDYSEAKYIALNYVRLNKTVKKETKDIFKNKVFCITGKVYHWKNRDEVKAFIETNGGKVTSSVSKNTNYLLNNDVDSTSSKNMSAKKLGIPIITEEELLSLLEQ